jgi:3-oxoacyl-[acyl-carrier protein] reductase
MPGRSEGRVALITGGARGIGAATAERLAEDGAAVALCDLDADAAETTAARIAARCGVKAIGLKADVANAAEVERMVEEVALRLGSLDILVNNAGITRDNLIHKMTDDDWDAVAAVHLKGAFLCSRAAQREMVKGNWGRIVNLSSVSALGNRGQTNYATAKAGLQGMARTLAIELGRYGITVNAVAPGFIDSEMTRATALRLGRDPDEWKAEIAQTIPVRRPGVPRDVANLIAFLCSDDASFISGQVIYIAGGPRG